MKHFKITEDMLVPIESAKKDIDFYTEEPYDVDNEQHVSYWAMAVALNHFKIGELVPEEELRIKINGAKIQQLIDHMISRGLMESYWDPEQQEIVYRVTKKGEDAVK